MWWRGGKHTHKHTTHFTERERDAQKDLRTVRVAPKQEPSGDPPGLSGWLSLSMVLSNMADWGTQEGSSSMYPSQFTKHWSLLPRLTSMSRLTKYVGKPLMSWAGGGRFRRRAQRTRDRVSNERQKTLWICILCRNLRRSDTGLIMACLQKGW